MIAGKMLHTGTFVRTETLKDRGNIDHSHRICYATV